jgi:hypothetical protein
MNNENEIDEKIRTLRVERNLPPSTIALALRQSVYLTTRDVRARLDAMGIAARKNVNVTSTALEEIKAGLLNGMNYRDLMMKYGVSSGVISTHAKKWGLTKPRSGPIDDETLKDKYVNQLWGVAKISKEYGWCKERIYRRLTQLGIARKSYAVKKIMMNERLGRLKLEGMTSVERGYPVVPLPEDRRSERKLFPSGQRPHGVIPVHILEMERHLGRRLNSGESVHHINGNKMDYRIENLCLCSSPSDHKLLHESLQEVGIELYRLGIIGFDTDKGYYLKKKPKEEGLVEVPEAEVAQAASDFTKAETQDCAK